MLPGKEEDVDKWFGDIYIDATKLLITQISLNLLSLKNCLDFLVDRTPPMHTSCLETMQSLVLVLGFPRKHCGLEWGDASSALSTR